MSSEEEHIEQCGHAERRTLRKSQLIAGLLSIIALFLMLRSDPLYLKDDGAFFLRYADHIASGYGYVWNIGEKGGIGASAPLWPPLIALVMLGTGAPAFVAVKCLAAVLVTLAFFLFFSASLRIGGEASGVVLLAAITGSGLLPGEVLGGLETPLTLLLLSAAFFLLTSDRRNPYAVTLLSALLLIHKLDMAPWAAGLLLAGGLSLREKRTWYALANALGLVVLFFTAMKLGTGYVLPVSLSHKFSQSLQHAGGMMPHGWFADTVFRQYGRWALTVPAALAFFILLPSQWRIVVFSATGLAGQVAAYTLFPPGEPFLWYACPAVMGVNMLMACLPAAAPWKLRPFVVALLLMCGMYGVLAGEEIRWQDLANAKYTEADRAEAGRWVAAHTPPSFRVAAGYGNPAFYSQRYVYDYSGLNRAGRSDLAYIIRTYAPEILILCPWKTGIRPELYKHDPNDKMVMYFSYQIPPNYKLATYFDSARQSGYDDFYALVMVRRDVAGQLLP